MCMCVVEVKPYGACIVVVEGSGIVRAIAARRLGIIMGILFVTAAVVRLRRRL